MTTSISQEQLRQLMAQGKDFTLLDVRRKDDYKTGPEKIPQAEWKDPSKVDSWRYSLPLAQLTVAYCKRGGPVSQRVVEHLRRDGLNALYLEGGIADWANQEGEDTP